MNRIILIVALCVGLGLAVAGCGDSDDPTTSAATTENSESAAENSENASEESEGASEESEGAEATDEKPKVTVPSGPPPKKLEQEDLVEGTGAKAKSGDQVTVNYVGVGYDSGKEFDSSWGREPFTFSLGTGEVIAGWDQGVVGMKVGGRRELVIPSNLAYGPRGFAPSIGKNEALIFVIDLVGVK